MWIFRTKQEYYEKTCEICGTEFRATHGNKRLCPACCETISNGRNRNLPRRYECPTDLVQYEERVRRQNIADYKDTIVAIGYAERQVAESLAMAGKVKVKL